MTKASSNTEIEVAIGTAVGASVTGVAAELTELATVLGSAGADFAGAATKITAYSTSFANSSPTVQAEIIAEAKAEAAKLVAAAQAEVAAINGQLSKVNALGAAEAAYASAQANKDDAATDLEAEISKFDVLNGTAVTEAYAAAVPGTSAATYVVSDGVTPIIELQSGRLVILPAGQNLEGIDALLNAARADYQTELAVEAAELSYAQRLVSAITGENPSATSTVSDTIATLEASAPVTDVSAR